MKEREKRWFERKKQGLCLWSWSSKRILPIDYSIFSSRKFRRRRRRRELVRDRSPEVPSEEFLLSMIWQSLIMKQIFVEIRSVWQAEMMMLDEETKDKWERKERNDADNTQLFIFSCFSRFPPLRSPPSPLALHIWDYCFCRTRERKMHWKCETIERRERRKMDQLELLLRCCLSGNKSTSRNYVPLFAFFFFVFFFSLPRGLSFLLHSLNFRNSSSKFRRNDPQFILIRLGKTSRLFTCSTRNE